MGKVALRLVHCGLGTLLTAHRPSALGAAGIINYCVLLAANFADGRYLLSLHSHIFAGGWFVAGEADWDGDGLGSHHQRGLGDDHLPRLEVAGGHQVAAQLGGAAHLHTQYSTVQYSTVQYSKE